MKTERHQKSFRPVVITLETADEVNALRAMCNHCVTSIENTDAHRLAAQLGAQIDANSGEE